MPDRQPRLLQTCLALISLAALLPLASAAPVAALAALPQGFYDSEFAVGFAGRLTTMTFAPDGRLFVSEKQGNVRIVKNGALLANPFLALATDSNSENGLKGIAFDPAYATNRFVYVYYTDPATLKNRVSRFTASSADPDTVEPNSEQVLLDGIATGTYRTGGALHFGGDGKLYISTGDASYAPNGQQLANLNGKILRINRDGSIPADNPFVGQAGKRAEIWAYGFRNPFTFAFHPGNGHLFINDVGQDTWEELNEVTRGGNYGWPTCEGVCGNPSFIDPIYTYNHADGPGKSITGAVFYNGSMFPAEYAGDYFFGDYVGSYIKRYDVASGTVVDFATNALYPVDLDVGPDGALYYLSVETRKVHRIAFGETPPPPPPADGNLFQNPGFEAGALTPWRANVRSPASATIARDTNQHLSGAASLRVDVAAASSDWYVQVLQPNIPLNAGVEHTFSFAARATSNRTIRLAFQKNTAPYPLYFQQSLPITTGWQVYTAKFTPQADDPRTLFALNVGAQTGSIWLDDVSLTVPQSNGQPPTAVISAPNAGTTYRAGDTITYGGSAADPEDGDLDASHLLWEVAFHHDAHTHPFIEPFSDATGGTFVTSVTGESSANTWYRIHLTAIDSAGNTHHVTRDIVPLTATVTLATQPSGLTINLDGTPVTAPHTFTGVRNFQRELSAPQTQTVGGAGYRFVSWSDGGSMTHTISVPETATTITAVYEPVAGSNLFQNGGFENGGSSWLAPWRSNIRSPAQATLTREVANPASGSAAMRVDITAASLDWYVQVLHPNISLTAGVQHTLSFAARATANRTIRLAFHRNSAPFPVYFQQSIPITSGWQVYTVTFKPPSDDPRSLFALNVGGPIGTLWLDDVSLTR